MALPGELKAVSNTGHYCEDCGKPATWRFCVESDSFGSEFAYSCDDHKPTPQPVSWPCERCGSKKDVKAFRDPAEGSHGPVYYWCGSCRTAAIDNF